MLAYMLNLKRAKVIHIFTHKDDALLFELVGNEIFCASLWLLNLKIF